MRVVGPVKDRRGIALLLVLFTLVILVVMGTAFAYMTQTESRMAQSYEYGVQAHYIAMAGIERAIAELRNDIDATQTGAENAVDHLGEDWYTGGTTGYTNIWVPVAGQYTGMYSVSVTDENSKLSINPSGRPAFLPATADEDWEARYTDVLKRMLDYAALPKDITSTEAGNIVNYNSNDDSYRIFATPAELLSISGLDSDIYNLNKDFLTVWSYDENLMMEVVNETFYPGETCYGDSIESTMVTNFRTTINIKLDDEVKYYDDGVLKTTTFGDTLDDLRSYCDKCPVAPIVYFWEKAGTGFQGDGSVSAAEAQADMYDYVDSGSTKTRYYYNCSGSNKSLYGCESATQTGCSVTPKNDFFDTVIEMTSPRIRNVDDTAFAGIADNVLISWGGTGLAMRPWLKELRPVININTAPKEVLTALFTGTQADAIISYREGSDGPFDDRGEVLNVTGITRGDFIKEGWFKYERLFEMITVRSPTFKIISTGRIGVDGNDDGDLDDSGDTIIATKTIEAVVDRGILTRTVTPYCEYPLGTSISCSEPGAIVVSNTISPPMSSPPAPSKDLEILYWREAPL